MNLKFKPVLLSENGLKVLEKRYLSKNESGEIIETPEEMLYRVASAVAKADLLYGESNLDEIIAIFYSMMSNLDFLPNSPTLMNAGKELGQLSACFVLPVPDSMEGIFEAVKNAALIHKSGGGTGFSFSSIRPKNDIVMSTAGVSSGPLSFMTVFDAATNTIKQGGKRRGANMAVLRVDHPDILDFIEAKSDKTKLVNFNISVAITDDFMKAVENNASYDLVNPKNKRVVGKLNARDVFKKIIYNAWYSGEPGVIFIDKINAANPIPHVGLIESTNPCGEQPLLPYESCNLGSINLANMVSGKSVDFEKLEFTVKNAVHFLDNVIDVNRFPLPIIEETTKSNRKIGLGVMGFADMLIKLEIPYNSDRAVEVARMVMRFIRDKGFEMSQQLAKKRGAFPNFKGSIYDRQNLGLVRNATITTIAPTGTISIIAGVSSGIEPLFSIVYTRNVMDNSKLTEVNSQFLRVAKENGFYSEDLIDKIAKGDFSMIPEKWRKIFVTSSEISPEWHIKIQSAFQEFVDNAVSKTINFPNSSTESDVETAFLLAYKLNCKGITVYRDGSREGQVLTKPKETYQGRPEVVSGSTVKMVTGCGNLYVTLNNKDNKPFELFATMGKAGGCSASQTEAISRLISLALRSGIAFDSVIKQLKGIRCPIPAREKGGNIILSCADAIAKAMERSFDGIKSSNTNSELDIVDNKKEMKNLHNNGDVMYPTCLECGSVMVPSEGCYICPSCGYSKCS